ncbi:PepSY-associated TM helix domain-containing protein [Teredinibacter turnerae]|uniref:PepSY-associated TM helix domain-containing protein n=1 Tax=Teredinibacter turnerae TaxID=2426 RepID=UPI0004111763|nr:PepSY-associated TM helix domain-containing protein [Teredinibacter turnerae]
MKLRSDILKVYQSLHTWTGIVAGLLLFIAFYAGALTMFKQPIDRWLNPPSQHMTPLAIEDYDLLIDQVLTEYPGSHKGFTLKLETTENVVAPIMWNTAGRGHEIELSSPNTYATLGPDKELVVRETTPSVLAELIDMLHRTAGIPFLAGHEYIGIYILGIASVLYFLALSSGVILLLPTLVKDFFALRPGKNKKRFWLDAHNIIGITSLPFHIIISLSAIVFAFHDQFYDGLRQVVYPSPETMFNLGEQPPKRDFSVYDIRPVSEILADIKERAPNVQVSELLYMNLDTPRAMVRAAVIDTDFMVTGAREGYLGIHPYTGDVLRSGMLPGQEGTWGSIVNKFFSLHFGSFGGDPIRWVYFFLGIGGAVLFYTGNLLWLEKRRKKLKRNDDLPSQRRACHVMARLTVGVCLGSIAGVFAAMVSVKWFHIHLENTNVAATSIYYAVFIGGVAWALFRGAARAGVELCLLCAITALLIPATSLTGALLPALGPWAHTSVGVVAVDLTALIGAICFFTFANIAWQRAKNGPADSVWSLGDASPKTALETAPLID